MTTQPTPCRFGHRDFPSLHKACDFYGVDYRTLSRALDRGIESFVPARWLVRKAGRTSDPVRRRELLTEARNILIKELAGGQL